MKIIKNICILSFALISVIAYGQSAKQILSSAEKAFSQGNYYTAAINYQKLVDIYEGNAYNTDGTSYPYQYARSEKVAKDFDNYKSNIKKLGESYRLYGEYALAEKAYAKAVSLDDNKDVYCIYHYGKVLQANQKYDESYIQFRKVLSHESASDELKEEAEFDLKCSLFGSEEMAHPRVGFINPIDSANVNEESSSNYAAVVTTDNEGDTVLLFTTTRVMDKGHEGDFINHLVTYKDGALQQKSVPVVSKSTHLAAASVSADGKWLYAVAWAVSDDEDKPKVYGLYQATRDSSNADWKNLQLLPPSVNDYYSDNLYPTISDDGTKLYFSSNREGGYGNFDLYYVNLDEDGWPNGEAVNLGEEINTALDEKTPYFQSSTNTLYFSSNGHVGLGHLDIFSSQWEDGAWTTPENLGYPFNSATDDAYPYLIANGGGEGFLSSDRSKECCYELFTFEVGYYHATGRAVEKGTDIPVAEATILVRDSLTGKILKKLTTDEDGYYDFDLRVDQKYYIVGEKEDYIDDDLYYNTPERVLTSDSITLENLELFPIRIGKAVVLKNIFYDYDKATLRPESKKELDALLEMLLKRPDLIVEIGSHTDSKGSDLYNLQLSQRRSESVIKYLIAGGFNKDNITARGYGEYNPVAPNTLANGNDNPEGRQLNRRTEFTVIGKTGETVMKAERIYKK